MNASPENRLVPGEIRAFHGPNIWSQRPVIEVALRTGDFRFSEWSRANELLLHPGLDAVAAAGEGTEAAMHWLGETLVRLQTAGQTPVAFHAQRPGRAPHEVRLAFEFVEEPLGREALNFALRWLQAVTGAEPFDLASEWDRFLDFAYDARIGNSTGPIVDAAQARGIPCWRLDNVSLVQIGSGQKQRRVRRAATDRTGMIANDVSTDKELAKSLLAAAGIPVPRGRAVDDAADACVAAREAGWPVVVKPQDADYGNGVTMRIMTEEGVRSAYAFAREHSEGVLVEHHVPGHLFRMLVVAGQLVAAIRREPWFVVGDGRSTLLELIEQANHDDRRGPGYVSPIERKRRETGTMPVLAPDGRAHDSVPSAGETVVLRHDVYLKCGGIHLDQTDRVHPRMKQMALDAAAVIGLDIAGLDVIAEDLARSPAEQELAVLEVNSEPSIALHLEPLCVPSRPVGEAIVESLFPAGESGRIPVIAVLGLESDLAQAREEAGKRAAIYGTGVGWAGREGAWLDGEAIGSGCGSALHHARRLWRHPRTALAVVHVTLADVLREGLAFDRCDALLECRPELELLAGFKGAEREDAVLALARVRASVAGEGEWR